MILQNYKIRFLFKIILIINNKMNKKLCFIYTETTGLHKYGGEVSKKKLDCFARLVKLNYEIGYIEDKQYFLDKEVSHIIKPRCMYIPDETIKYHGITNEIAKEKGVEIEDVIKEFIEDVKDIDIIISHNIDFHLRTILAEIIRYNIYFDISKYIILDTISFSHNYGFIKLKDLAQKVGIKEINETNENNTELIRNVFFKLYNKYKKSI